MKIFAIGVRYADPNPKYSPTTGKVGVAYIEADNEEEAKRKYGHDGIFAVKEISMEEFLLTGE